MVGEESGRRIASRAIIWIHTTGGARARRSSGAYRAARRSESPAPERLTDLLCDEAPQTWIVLQSFKRSAVARLREAGSERTGTGRRHAVPIPAPRRLFGWVGGKRWDAVGAPLVVGRLDDNVCRALLYGRARCLVGLSPSGRPARNEAEGDHGKQRRGMQGSGAGAGGHGFDPLPAVQGAITLFGCDLTIAGSREAALTERKDVGSQVTPSAKSEERRPTLMLP
jgi:hypothetical protein